MSSNSIKCMDVFLRRISPASTPARHLRGKWTDPASVRGGGAARAFLWTHRGHNHFCAFRQRVAADFRHEAIVQAGTDADGPGKVAFLDPHLSLIHISEPT